MPTGVQMRDWTPAAEAVRPLIRDMGQRAHGLVTPIFHTLAGMCDFTRASSLHELAAHPHH